MGKGFSKMKKQAKMFEEQFSKMQEELKNQTFDGEAGSGLVKVSIDGEKHIKSIQIQKECVDPEDIDGLQDLIIGALENAYDNLDKNSPMNDLQQGFNLPF